MNRAVVAEAHPLGDAAGVVLVGLHRPRGQKALCLARLDTHDRYAFLAKPSMEPLRQWAGLDPDKLDDAGPLRQSFDQRAGLTRNLALPMDHSVVVNNAHRGFGERCVEPDETRMEVLLVSSVESRPTLGASGPAPITPARSW